METRGKQASQTRLPVYLIAIFTLSSSWRVRIFSVLLFIQNSSQKGLLKNIICVFIVQENILLLARRKEKTSCNDQI